MKIKNSKYMEAHSNEHGAIIVLVAIMSVALMMMIGLVIDTSKLSTSKTAHEHTADMIALAMMESYSTQDIMDPQSDRIIIAAQRAEQVAEENLDAWVANGYLSNNDNGQDELIAGSTLESEGNTSGANGMIIPGFWFFEKPDTCTGPGTYTPETWMRVNSTVTPEGNACPCNYNTTNPGVDSDGWKGSCFKSVDIQNPDVIVNAFKVRLNTSNGSKVQNTFMGARKDSATFGLYSEAVAAIVPRNILLTMDISPSSTEETHRLDTNPNTPATDPTKYGDFVYEVAALDDSNDPLSPRPSPSPAILGNFTCEVDFTNGLPGVTTPNTPFDATQCMLFSCLNEQFNAPAPANTMTGFNLSRRYCADNAASTPDREQTDYQIVEINTTDGDIPNRGRVAFQNTHFLIDSQTRPEPLASLLQGVHSGMVTFQDRGTGADQFGFMAFDDDYLPLRSTTVGGLPSLVKTGTQEFVRFRNATDYNSQTSLPIEQRPYVQNLLIPRRFSGQSHRNGGRGAYAQSDLGGVFAASLGILQNAPNSEIAASSLIMFTDGMSSCRVQFEDNDPARPISTTCNTGDESINRFATNQIIRLARDEFAAAGVAFHVFLIGQDVAPHTQPRSGGDGTCLTDEQARRQDDPNSTSQDNLYVNFGIGIGGGSFNNRSPSSPWYYPNALYQAARWTGGAYVPLRPPCVDDSTPPIPIDITDELDAACASRNLNERLFTSLNPVFDNPVMTHDGLSVLYNDSVDGVGRLLCDPRGRSLEDQVAEEMQQILEKSPFLLVSERPAS